MKLKIIYFVFILSLCNVIKIKASKQLYPYSKLEEVDFREVTINDLFWNSKLQTIQDVTLPLLLDIAEQQGKIDNFRIVSGKKHGKIKLYNAPDSDIYKLLEAVGYLSGFRKSIALEKRCDDIIDDIVSAQDTNGYLNTQYALPFEHPASPPKDNKHVKAFGYGKEYRWNSLSSNWPKGYSQLYCAGHMMEAAVAYYKGTGKRKFLNAAIRLANHICEVFDKAKIISYGEHPQVEIGLMKLYEVTGESRYSEMANLMCRYIKFTRPIDINRQKNSSPLHEQYEAYGHCVRTAYIYTGATHVLRVNNEYHLNKAIFQLWENIVNKKMYLHGGTGNGTPAEQHGEDYELPISPTYSECCANIAQGQWNHQLNLLTGVSKYASLVELEMFNSALSGISLDGISFFYSNKINVGLENRVNEHSGVRKTYLFCCPSKIPGFIAGIGRWIYAKDSTGIYINQYVGGSLKTLVSNTPIALTMQSDYAYNGRIRLSIESKGQFALNLRIPQWLNQKGPIPGSSYFFDSPEGKFTLFINGKKVDIVTIKNGYLHLARNWTGRDVLELSFDMNVKRIYTTSKIKANSGRVALMYGPMLYCLEGIDNPFDISKMVLPAENHITSGFDNILLGGVRTLTGKGIVEDEVVSFKAIPYYCWQNRGIFAMSMLLIESMGEIEKEYIRNENEFNTNG